MNISILSGKDLTTIQTTLAIPNATLAATVRAIIKHYCHHEEVQITITRPLLCSSYRLNPTQFAKAANVDGRFTRAGARTNNDGSDTFTFYFSDTPHAPSIFTQICQALESNEPITVPHADLPECYQHNITLLRYRLKRATGLRVLTDDLKKGIKFKATKGA